MEHPVPTRRLIRRLGWILAVMVMGQGCVWTTDQLPGEKWSGVATGGGRECYPVSFHIAIEDRVIAGEATLESGARTDVFKVIGRVGPYGRVSLHTGAIAHWTGQMTEETIEITQLPSRRCSSPRRGMLTRVGSPGASGS